MQIFAYCNKNVRTITKDDEPWFVLKDVCDVLEIANSKNVAARLDEDEKGVHQMDTLGGVQKMSIINESGLYKVILRSDKPSAKKFMNWITHEVLPTIRKHGAYITSEKIEEFISNPENWIKLLKTLKQEQQEKMKLQKQIEKDKPKIIFADAVAASDTDILIGELAKILRGNGIKIGQNRLFKKLRQYGFLISREGCDFNMPSQKAMDMGLLKYKETAIAHSDGHITISKTVKITGKGQAYFVNYFTRLAQKPKVKAHQCSFAY